MIFFVPLQRIFQQVKRMKAKKILFITQEITPYVPETPMSNAGRILPQAIQDSSHEIRTFMPRWGVINARRNQLHEVIRLSGMNIVIDDTDHPLIIKVASIQAARMQVYFIDNDDYFHKRQMMVDENGVEYEDNIERAVFYARGVLETVKKLRWCPDVIHCQGWMSAFAPLYIKSAYREEPPFANAKVVFSGYDEMPVVTENSRIAECLAYREATADLLKEKNIDLSQPDALGKLAVAFSDGYIQGEENVLPNLLDFAKESGIPTLEYPGEDNKAEIFGNFYDEVFGGED